MGNDFITWTDPTDITFSHDYITAELDKFNLDIEGCMKCNGTLSHFSDPRSLYDKIGENRIIWIKNPEALMTTPQLRNEKIPIYDLQKLSTTNNAKRPRGHIQLSRVTEKIQDKGEFRRIAMAATYAILHSLKTRPLAIKEVQFKINIDIDNKVLVSLTEFLQYPQVIAQGITASNVNHYLTSAGLILVFNPQSDSSKVRLCVDPSRVAKITKKSVNDTFHAGFPHIPDIAQNLIKSQFYLTVAIADIANFYMNNHLDIEGALLSAVFLQRPVDGSQYPTLDPERQAPLMTYLYTGSRFGYTDAGSLSCLAKTKLMDLYSKHYPIGLNKLSENNLAEVKAKLIASYVDDLLTGSTIADVSAEIKHPTLRKDMIPPFDTLTFTEKSEILTMTSAGHIIHVLDFNGFQLKKWESTSPYIELTLNKDPRLTSKIDNPTKSDQIKLSSKLKFCGNVFLTV
jgi:hypothetical protein